MFEERTSHTLPPQRRAQQPRVALASTPRTEVAIPELVAKMYEAAPQEERRALLALLLRPLGILSLAAIGSGIFAHLRLRGGWPEFQPAVEDLQRVRTSDMVALVHHVQQVSIETVYGLAAFLKGSPVLAGSATAAGLLALLVQRARRHRGGDGGPNGEESQRH